MVDGRGLGWQRLCELRREQLEAWRLSQAQQLTLFPMQADAARLLSARRGAAMGSRACWSWCEARDEHSPHPSSLLNHFLR